MLKINTIDTNDLVCQIIMADTILSPRNVIFG